MFAVVPRSALLDLAAFRSKFGFTRGPFRFSIRLCNPAHRAFDGDGARRAF